MFVLLEWFGVIFMRQGLYQGGVFRFTLYVPDNYPDCECPVSIHLRLLNNRFSIYKNLFSQF